MKSRSSLMGLLVRYKTHLIIGGLIACGLWAAWIAWMTRPGDIDVPAMSASICGRALR
ncbi:hypothetical protein [Burkholderia diffusa]|uniref:hypothetical protein n=1 Tax=Burkholderia diffusa TaxID=488732 RepID=UPI0018C882F4|nr:hypothetical protein [Burkholderia diffusa]